MSYKSEWKDDECDGNGKFTSYGGTVYVCEWGKSKCHGKGRNSYPRGDYETGRWEHGLFQGGSGRLLEYGPSNADYEGQIDKYSEPDGRGTMTYKNGQVLSGIWKGAKCKACQSKHQSIVS